jgi:uncharacterized protein
MTVPDDAVLGDPFHAGERALQHLAGVRERMAEIGPRVIRDYMPDQHREFFTRLPFLIVGSLDAEGQPWPSVLHGPVGFAHSLDPRRLRIDALPSAGSVLAAGLTPDAPLGLLGIQLYTRRRNRLNGRVGIIDANGFELEVEQSFGNCSKYIHAREALPQEDADGPCRTERLGVLDADAMALISRADTMFIASAHEGAVDVSHRGGAPGFVAVDASGQLLLPDYAGNFFFNTLGNLLREPRAGLLFIDFDSGDLLQLTANAQVVFDGRAILAGPKAQRLVQFAVTSALRVSGGLPLRWRETLAPPRLVGGLATCDFAH